MPRKSRVSIAAPVDAQAASAPLEPVPPFEFPDYQNPKLVDQRHLSGCSFPPTPPSVLEMPITPVLPPALRRISEAAVQPLFDDNSPSDASLTEFNTPWVSRKLDSPDGELFSFEKVEPLVKEVTPQEPVQPLRRYEKPNPEFELLRPLDSNRLSMIYSPSLKSRTYCSPDKSSYRMSVRMRVRPAGSAFGAPLLNNLTETVDFDNRWLNTISPLGAPPPSCLKHMPRPIKTSMTSTHHTPFVNVRVNDKRIVVRSP